MFRLETEIDIEAPADLVWQILTDFDRLAEWNPFIKAIEGELSVGSRLRVELHQIESKPMVFRPTVVAVEPGRRFAWRGRFLVPHLMDGEHWYELESLGPNRTRFKQYEHFSGLLVPLLKSMFRNKTRPSFQGMNQALKARAEAAVAHP